MANDELVELNNPTADETFAALFGPYEQAPVWLYHPARPLARAEQRRRNPVKRLADLQQMAQEIDRIYRDYLPAFFSAGGRQAAAGAAWTPALSTWAETLNRRATRLYEDVVIPELARIGFEIAPVAQAATDHAVWLRDYFDARVRPLLVPLAVDPGRPFPHISSDSLNLLVELRDGSRGEPAALFARVKTPHAIPRLIRLPSAATQLRATYVWSGDLVGHFVADLFVGMPVHRIFYFRLLRAHAPNPVNRLQPLQGERAKRFGPVVRVDVESDMPPRVMNWLLDHLDVASNAVVRYDAPLPLMSLPQLAAEAAAWLNGGDADR
jgi:polyphosphate kinase